MRNQHAFRSEQSPRKEKLINIALFITSMIFSFLALEVSLRAYHGQWVYINFRFPGWAWFEAAHRVSYDAELGWIPKRNTKANILGTTVTILEDGIRSTGNGGLPDDAEPILAVGDSYTFGDEVSDWETWPAQLEKLTGRKVINGGVFGYGIDQAFLRAQSFLSRHRFRTVIFSFIADDIRRCQMSINYGWHKPYFDFKNGRLTLENVPLPPPSPRAKESELLIALEHSLLVHAVMKRLFPKWWFSVPWDRQVQDQEEGRKVACALLHELEGLTKSRGSQLIILAEHGNAERLAESSAVEGVLTCLSDPATGVLDLKLALSELKANDLSRYQRLYKPNHGHMTGEGNQFVALEISKFLTQTSTQAEHTSAGSDNSSGEH